MRIIIPQRITLVQECGSTPVVEDVDDVRASVYHSLHGSRGIAEVRKMGIQWKLLPLLWSKQACENTSEDLSGIIVPRLSSNDSGEWVYYDAAILRRHRRGIED